MGVVLVGLLAACSVAPAATPLPTITASPSPTFTAIPTEIPPSATPTAEASSPTPATPESTLGTLDCRLLTQSLRNGSHIGPKDRFDMGWLVRNTGTAVWDPGAVEFVYLGGTRMFVSPQSALQETTEPGNSTLLVADMVAPKSDGAHTTIWALRKGSDYFCRVSVTITVP
jgi:hypothetical protein